MSSSSSSYHHGDLKQALVEAGAQLIEIDGISGISLRAVAKHAGVSHSAPYRHFKDKNALLSGIADVGFQQLAQSLRQSIEKNPDNPREQLLESGVAYIRLALRYRQMHNLMFGGVIKKQANDDTAATSDTAFLGLVQIIENGQLSGVYKQGDVKVLALTAWSLVHGYAMLASTGLLDHIAESEEASLALAKTIESHLIDGIRE
jgi:AcrR family transcriptional regulator